MLRTLIPIASGIALTASLDLSTDYSKPRSLRVEVESTVKMETTDFSMERDGEPMEGRGFGGGATTTSRHIVQIDELVAGGADGPSHVLRTFEKLSMSTSSERGGETNEDERTGSLEDFTLEIKKDEEGDAVVTVKEGGEPDDAALLEGHDLALALDALLPEDEVEVDGTWDLDADAVKSAFGFDLQATLFPRPEREPRGEGEGRGRGRGGSRRGGGGAQIGQVFASAEWEGTARLVSENEEYEGSQVAVIELKIEASGELPERQGGGFGGRGGEGREDREAPEVDSSFEIELEGRLLFSVLEKRPVLLEIEGEIATDMVTQRSFRESTMVISNSQEGSFTYTVTLSEDTE